MKVLIISPLGKVLKPDSRYVGIERLVFEYVKELVKTHTVAVMGHADSIFPHGITVYATKPLQDEVFVFDELRQFRTWQKVIRDYDVIHDFSHQHLASRFMPNLPSLNLFWHAPAIAQYPKAPYNIIGLSEWATREFKRVYRQGAKYQQSICIDTNLYKLSERHRNDRFLVVGRMGAEKGNLNAARLCHNLGLSLDIITARAESNKSPLTDYEKEVMKLADGIKIKIWWEKDYTEESKIKMMQTARALLYVTDHPEVTNHKVQEAMLCGCPVIAPNIGALPEIVTHKVDGFLCDDEQGFIKAIENIDKLNPKQNYEQTKKKYCVENVVANYIPLYELVKKGERW